MTEKRKAPDLGGNQYKQVKDNQKTLTFQDIEHLKRTQQKTLLVVLNQANCALNMRQLALRTSIDRPSICRRLSELQELGLVQLAYYAPCPISKYPKVGFYVKGDQGNERN